MAVAHVGLTASGLGSLAEDIANAIFNTLDKWMAEGDVHLLLGLWRALGATTEPFLGGSGFGADFGVMATIGAAVTLPLLGLAVIQAVARQDASGLLRTALVRLPFAILFTAVVVQLVRLGLAATDQASTAVLSAAGSKPLAMFTGLAGYFQGPLSGFVDCLLSFALCLVCFFVWFELVVRAAAVAIATLFLPLALAGLAWPATSHWARRLGETLGGLVLVKLVIAAVLALAVGALTGPFSSFSGVMAGIALLVLAAVSPFAVLRLIPMVEQGAVSHLDGIGRRGSRAVGSRVGAAGSSAAAALSDRFRQQSGGGGGGSGGSGAAVPGGTIPTRNAGTPASSGGAVVPSGAGGSPPAPSSGGLGRLRQLEEALAPAAELTPGGRR